MTDISSIPLNKLVASQDNVRRTAGADEALRELAASIAAHGLLQWLVVRKHRKGKYAVVAGGRRLAAMQLLADEGKIDAAYAVPCQVRDEADAVEISLAENVLRASSDPDEEMQARIDKLGEQVDALRDSDTFWPQETLAIAGAVVCIDSDGEADIWRGPGENF